MRLLHADTDDIGNPLAGGQPVRTFEINRRLARNHDITVFTATYSGAQRSVIRDDVKYRRLGFRIPGSGLSPHLSFLAALGPAIRSNQHDLVVEEFTPPVGFCLLPLWTRRPVVSLVQWHFFYDWEKRYKLPFERGMRFLASKGLYRHFIVQTEAMAARFRTLVPSSQIWTIPCGIETTAYQPCFSDSGTGGYVLFLGRLDVNHKGLDLLIDAWGELRREGVAPRLILAGEGPGRKYLENRIFTEGLHQNIVLAGKVVGEEKQRLLRECRLLVMPSRQETFGMAALEAMASGKPVVACDIENLNEVVRPDWGRLVPFGDTFALAKAIHELYSDTGLCAILGKMAFARSREYDWDQIASRQEEVYRLVAGS